VGAAQIEKHMRTKKRGVVRPKEWAAAIKNSEEKTMTTGVTNLIHKSTRTILGLALVGSLATATPLLAAKDGPANKSGNAQAVHEHAAMDAQSPAKLVQLVRAATAQYIDVNAATAAGYSPFLGCVSGSDHGAMGIHYVNGALLGPSSVDPSQPQALIYEPSNGKMRLVGVEFIVDSATWLSTHTAPPVLEGQVFLLNDAPNRFNIPAFFELHVWAWRDNPQGAFVDWNNSVTCENQ
jgi:hypothetical protein